MPGGKEESSVPALGLVWSHCVNSRIVLRRDTAAIRGQGAQQDVGADEDSTVQGGGKISVMRSRRWMVLLTCPYLPTPRRCRFEIQNSGIIGLEDSASES